jgi:hypothetical protein
MTTNKFYETPLSETIDMEAEGILCASPGNESIGEEEGNGGFI